MSDEGQLLEQIYISRNDDPNVQWKTGDVKGLDGTVRASLYQLGKAVLEANSAEEYDVLRRFIKQDERKHFLLFGSHGYDQKRVDVTPYSPGDLDECIISVWKDLGHVFGDYYVKLAWMPTLDQARTVTLWVHCDLLTNYSSPTRRFVDIIDKTTERLLVMAAENVARLRLIKDCFYVAYIFFYLYLFARFALGLF